ncbi:hypothetical protein EGW08_020621, partial [Elysia chlorotica]
SDTLERLINHSLELLRLHEERDKWINFDFGSAILQLMWTDSKESRSFVVEFSVPEFFVTLTVPMEMIQEALKPLPNLQDSFVNIMFYISSRVHYLRDSPKLNQAFVSINAESKSGQHRLKIQPKEKPIIIEYKNLYREKKVLTLPLYVYEEDGKVVDSSCVLFSIPQSSLYNITLNLEFSHNYSYSFAAILAKYPSESINFADIEFKPVGQNTSYFIPQVSSMHKYDYPLSRAMFMFKVPTHAWEDYHPVYHTEQYETATTT